MGGSLLTLVELIADTSLKNNNKIVGYGGYLVLAYMLDNYYRQDYLLGKTNSMWDATSEIATAYISYKVYNESYETKDIMGVLAIATGIYLINN